MPPAPGVCTSDLSIVIEWVWALTLVELKVFDVDGGGGGVVEPEHLDWVNAANAPIDPSNPVTRNSFLVILTSFRAAEKYSVLR
jgi:hypothetical protein